MAEDKERILGIQAAESSGGLKWWDPIVLRLSAWMILLGGLLHSIGHRYDEAEEAYRLVLERHPGSDVARMMLADSLERQGRWQEAAEVYTEMVELDENAYYYRGACLHEFGRFDEAVSDFSQAIRLYPRHFAAYVTLGQALGRLGRRCARLLTSSPGTGMRCTCLEGRRR